jgi:hypothetical protein
MTNELERIWKEGHGLYLKYYPGICLEELMKILRNLSRVAGFWAET